MNKHKASAIPSSSDQRTCDPRDAMVEWQRRMFLASPEPRDNPMVQRVVQQFHGVTLSRAEADYIIDQVNMVTHG